MKPIGSCAFGDALSPPEWAADGPINAHRPGMATARFLCLPGDYRLLSLTSLHDIHHSTAPIRPIYDSG